MPCIQHVRIKHSSLHKWLLPLSQQISASSFLFAKMDQSNKSDTLAYSGDVFWFVDDATLVFCLRFALADFSSFSAKEMIRYDI